MYTKENAKAKLLGLMASMFSREVPSSEVEMLDIALGEQERYLMEDYGVTYDDILPWEDEFWYNPNNGYKIIPA